ncbi:carboxypeptidase-like regulatory domain-containing protein [candidate division TA06 bacterium]|nr:carboxypeptidase-like regulatory domain-containing protein [candidate division TA06 bacterium]
MKHSVLYIIAALMVFGTLTFAGTTGTITGKVIDGATNQPLIGMQISLGGHKEGITNTDFNGCYTFNNVPFGHYYIILRIPFGEGEFENITLDTTIVEKNIVLGDVPVENIEITSDKLKDTYVTPHFYATISFDKNVLYCGSFQVAWNKLQNDVFKEPLLLLGNPLDAQQLNKMELTENDLDSNSYVSIAGILNNLLLNQVNSELKRKFGYNAPFVSEAQDKDSRTILAYSFLYKNLNSQINLKKVYCR